MEKLGKENWERIYLFMEKEFSRIKIELNSFLEENSNWGANLELSNIPPAINIKFWLKSETRPIKEEETHDLADFLGKILTPFLKAVRTPFIVRQDLKNAYILEYEIRANKNSYFKIIEEVKESLKKQTNA